MREPRPSLSSSFPSHSARLPRSVGAIVAASVVAAAWGAFAFGAVYPWAYTPLAGFCAVIGGAGLLTGRRHLSDNRALLAGLGAIAVIAILQTIPLPQSLLAIVSPGTDRFLRSYDLGFATGLGSNSPDAPPGATPDLRHAISLRPSATFLALGLFSALAVFLAGLLKVLSRESALRLARGLVFVGAILALVGIVQKALLGDNAFLGMKIYGFWTPRYLLTTPFGPYVNKNHFAGWMLMVVPLAFGLVLGAVEKNLNAMGPGARRKLLWLSSPAGGQVLILGFAAILMSLSLLMTRSRSGLASLVAVAVLLGVVAAARLGSRRNAMLVASIVVAGLLLLLVWAGADTAVSRLSNQPSSVELRLRIWRIALDIARDFPVFGSGLDTFGLATIQYQPSGASHHYQEAHNDYVQVLAEGGVLTVLAMALAIGATVAGVRRRFRAASPRPDAYWLRVGASVGLVAIALQSVVEFSLQMPGNAAAFVIMLALALYTPGPVDGPR